MIFAKMPGWHYLGVHHLPPLLWYMRVMLFSHRREKLLDRKRCFIQDHLEIKTADHEAATLKQSISHRLPGKYRTPRFSPWQVFPSASTPTYYMIYTI